MSTCAGHGLVPNTAGVPAATNCWSAGAGSACRLGAAAGCTAAIWHSLGRYGSAVHCMCAAQRQRQDQGSQQLGGRRLPHSPLACRQAHPQAPGMCSQGLCASRQGVVSCVLLPAATAVWSSAPPEGVSLQWDGGVRADWCSSRVPVEGCGLPGRGAGRASVAGQRGAPARRNPPLQRPRHSASNARRILERWPACGRAGGDSPGQGLRRLPSRAALLPLVRLWESVLAELGGAGWHAQASGEARAVGPVGGPAQAHWRQIPAGLRLSTG